MPIWTWAQNATNATDPNGTTGLDPILGAIPLPWSSWVPTDDYGEPIVSPGNYNTIIGWRDDSLVGGGATERIFGYNVRLSFDWDGYILDRIGTLFTGPSNLFKVVPGGRNVNKSSGLKGFAKGVSNSVSMFTGFDGDANLVFANRFDYQYWGSKLNLTRRCDPTEITVTNMDKYITPSYVALFLYFTLSVTSQIFIRMNKKALIEKTAPASSMASISNKFLQGFVADNVVLGLLKWWDEKCIILLEAKKELEYLRKKIKLLDQTVKNITLNSTAKTLSYATVDQQKHTKAVKKSIDMLIVFATNIYKNTLIKHATDKATVALEDFNAKVFYSKNKML
jgi:hypothetical protein